MRPKACFNRAQKARGFREPRVHIVDDRGLSNGPGECEVVMTLIAVRAHEAGQTAEGSKRRRGEFHIKRGGAARRESRDCGSVEQRGGRRGTCDETEGGRQCQGVSDT